METKVCFKCNEEKAVEEFYRHPQMTDGRLGKCKVCTKRDTATNYLSNLEQIKAYDRKRNQSPERKSLALVYQAKRRKEHPDKYRARTAVGNALRDGRLTKHPCEICGIRENVQGHHSDYSQPLYVHWLCFKHHRELEHGQSNVAA